MSALLRITGLNSDIELGPKSADSVAKGPKCLATRFSRKDETTDNRRSMYPQAPPKLPVSSSPVDVVPHMIIRSPRLPAGKILFSDAKRLLQQNPHFSEVAGL